MGCFDRGTERRGGGGSHGSVIQGLCLHDLDKITGVFPKPSPPSCIPAISIIPKSQLTHFNCFQEKNECCKIDLFFVCYCYYRECMSRYVQNYPSVQRDKLVLRLVVCRYSFELYEDKRLARLELILHYIFLSFHLPP